MQWRSRIGRNLAEYYKCDDDENRCGGACDYCQRNYEAGLEERGAYGYIISKYINTYIIKL